jgi:hypothetical protein
MYELLPNLSFPLLKNHSLLESTLPPIENFRSFLSSFSVDSWLGVIQYYFIYRLIPAVKTFNPSLKSSS